MRTECEPAGDPDRCDGNFACIPPQGFASSFQKRAVTFYLWAFALSRTTPTRVAISVTVNPITAALVGATLLDEPISWNLVVRLVTAFVGIWIATVDRPPLRRVSE
jgi:drug/metabolite transporter (DMT)-like permease